MVKIDITFDEKTMNIFQNFIGKKFEKYKSDPFVYSYSVYGIVGLYIDKFVYKLTNLTEVMDHYGAKEDVAIFKKTDGNSRLLVSEMKVRYFFLKKKQKNIDMN